MSVNLYNATTDTLKNVAGDIINPKSVNEMIAPIEDGTASKDYAVGEQFIMNDLLCETTQAIAQGDTMVIGTNCEESEQLSKQVKDINISLSTKASINDSSTTSTTATWSANKINAALSSKTRIVGIKSAVPADNSDVAINYPDGVSMYSLFLGAKVLLPSGGYQSIPIDGIYFYSQPNYFQIHCYGVSSQYVGQDIWLYFAI